MKKIAFFLLILGFFSQKVICFSLKSMAEQYASTGAACPDHYEFMRVLNKCIERFKKEFKQTPYAQKLVVPSGSKVCLTGEIHGSFESEINNLSRLNKLNFLDDELKIINNKFSMVFLGDYVDRCPSGVEVIYSLAVLKLQNWERVILLRGNHETSPQNLIGGFLEEIRKKYYPSEEKLETLLESPVVKCVQEFFEWLPIVLFLGSGKNVDKDGFPFWIQCCHGGFEESINGDLIKKFLEAPSSCGVLKGYFEKYNIEVLGCGFLWTDFCNQDDSSICLIPNFLRGNQGFILNQATTSYLCKKYGIEAVFRGHQHSGFGLKIGGCYPQLHHWSDFENERLLKDAIESVNGFSIASVSFPVFTFSTAAQANVYMPYDCFGILTTADDYKNWRLRPYEFDISEYSKEYIAVSPGPKKIKKVGSCCCMLCKLMCCLPFKIGFFCCKKCCCCCCHKRNHNKDDNEGYVVVAGNYGENNDFF